MKIALDMETIKQICTVGRLRLKSTQIFIVAGSILLSLFTTVLCIGFMIRYEVDSEVSNVDDVDYWKDQVSQEQKIWYDKGIEELKIALNTNYVKGFPRNVKIFLANGIGAELLAAGRFQHVTTKPMPLAWESFPHLGRLKNSCSQADLCDASTVATALFGGVRSRFQMAGLDTTVEFRNCSAALNERHHVQSVLRQAQLAGLRTGFITTQRITGSTGAGLYAHLADSSWECDAMMPKGAIAAGCQDVARQLLESATGRNLNVIMGGGRQALSEKLPIRNWDPLDESICRTQNKRNYLRDWRIQKLQNKTKFEIVQHKSELMSLNLGSSLDYLLGVFANGDLRPVPEMPTLREMLNKAVQVLNVSHRGYLLIAEQYFKPNLANITQQLEHLQEFSRLIEHQTKNGNADTLTLVVFTKGPYLKHGLEMSDETEIVNDFFNIIEQDGLLENHIHDMAGDTMVFARGPRSSFFHGLHDETYLAHLVAFALQMGIFQNKASQQ